MFDTALERIAAGGLTLLVAVLIVVVYDLSRRLSSARAEVERLQTIKAKLEEARGERLAQAIDRIRDRWGEGAILRGSAYTSKLLVEATGGMGHQKEIARELRLKAPHLSPTSSKT